MNWWLFFAMFFFQLAFLTPILIVFKIYKLPAFKQVYRYVTEWSINFLVYVIYAFISIFLMLITVYQDKLSGFLNILFMIVFALITWFLPKKTITSFEFTPRLPTLKFSNYKYNVFNPTIYFILGMICLIISIVR